MSRFRSVLRRMFGGTVACCGAEYAPLPAAGKRASVAPAQRLYRLLLGATGLCCLAAFAVAALEQYLPASSIMVILGQPHFLRTGYLLALVGGACTLLCWRQWRPKLLGCTATAALLYVALTLGILFFPMGGRDAGVSIWMQHHPRYGLNGYPATCGRNWFRPDFDVTYCFDEQGWRRATREPRTGPPILFLGCSFAFGTGVEDEETFAARLAKETWPDRRVVNAAFPSWGTTFAHLVLTDYLEREPPQAVLYCWIDDHVQRNGLRASWHRNLMGRFVIPRYELVGGEVRYFGNDPLSAATWPDGPETDRREQELTLALIRDMRRRCQRQRIPWFFVALNSKHDDGQEVAIVHAVREGDMPFIDARFASTSFFLKDPHPTAEWHRAVAETIARHAGLREALSQPTP